MREKLDSKKIDGTDYYILPIISLNYRGGDIVSFLDTEIKKNNLTPA